VTRRSLLERLGNEGHYFNVSQPSKRLVPAGPDHAQIAAARGIVEYFDALDKHHGGKESAGSPRRVRELLRVAEMPLLSALLGYLKDRKGLRVLGPTNAEERAATVAFAPDSIDPSVVIQRLAERGFMAGNGNFYAVRVLEAMGIDPRRGAVRLSFVHYNSMQEITRLIDALDPILASAAS
jgi:selenocysteine lyase/cysteine desulfurase